VVDPIDRRYARSFSRW